MFPSLQTAASAAAVIGADTKYHSVVSQITTIYVVASGLQIVPLQD